MTRTSPHDQPRTNPVRVIEAFRLEGVSDQRLAEAIRPLVGAGLDASDLQAAISADLVSGLNDY